MVTAIYSLGANTVKPKYKLKNDLIRQAHIAVIGEIKASKNACDPENEWTLCDFVKARIDSVLWGTTDSTLFYLSAKDFKRSQKENAENRYLMFIYEGISARTVMNWNRSNFEIKEDSVLWFKDTTTLDLEFQALEKVLVEIELIRKKSNLEIKK